MAFVFPTENPFTLEWTLADGSGTPVNDATVTATLYSGRSSQLPEDFPGEPVEEFDDVTLEYVAASDGLYSVEIPGTFAAEIGGDYVVVIDAVRSAEVFGHWEIPAVITARVS